LVHDTPSQPPPLPEPPPFGNVFDYRIGHYNIDIIENSFDSYIGDIEKTINDPHCWLHSGTSVDGVNLLFRSMIRVEGFDDDAVRVPRGEAMKYDDDTIATMQPVLYQDVHDDRCDYSTTTIDRELILLFRLAYRVDKMYRVDTIHEDHTIVIMQLVVLYQDVHVKDDITDVMQLVVLYQAIVVMNQYDTTMVEHTKISFDVS
jgi:hypothetical protein